MTDNPPEPQASSIYKHILWTKDGLFYIEQPELKIRVKDADLLEAFNKFNDSLDAAQKEYVDSGAEPPSPSENPTGGEIKISPKKTASTEMGESGFAREIKTFLVKTAIVSIVIGFLGIFGLNYAVNSALNTAINRTVSYIPKIMSRGLATKAYIGMHEIAERLRQSTPEERDDLHRDLRTIAQQLKPFILELQEPPRPSN